MEWPQEAPVMVLPESTLFPRSFLPLYIFEPRYRRMLKDTLDGTRMFCLAMRKRGDRETPRPIAGLGLVRACVTAEDGTSRIVLEGVSRVQLGQATRFKPYRVHRIRPLPPPDDNSVVIDALVAKLRELVEIRLRQDLDVELLAGIAPLPDDPQEIARMVRDSIRRFSELLSKVEDPGQLADKISCTFLTRAESRQVILQTLDLERRLRHLVHFMMVDISRNRKDA